MHAHQSIIFETPAAFGVKVGVFDLGQSSAARKLGVAVGLMKLPALKVCGPMDGSILPFSLHRGVFFF